MFHFFFLFFVWRTNNKTTHQLTTHSDRQTYQTQPIFSVALLRKICLKQRKVNKNKFFQHRYCFRFHNSREYSRHDTRAKQELRFNQSLSIKKKENRVKHIKRALKATKRGEEDEKRQQAKTKTERERDDY